MSKAKLYCPQTYRTGKTPAQTALMLLRDLNTTRRTGDDFQGPLAEDALTVYDLERGYWQRESKLERAAQRKPKP